jgi:16S rRNA U516 pseudouridylate synthase RsuA-like enzyme
MGPLTLHGLEPGAVRTLTPREVKELKALAKARPPKRDGRPDAKR